MFFIIDSYVVYKTAVDEIVKNENVIVQKASRSF
mgnify:CR=1 FL=1